MDRQYFGQPLARLCLVVFFVIVSVVQDRAARAADLDEITVTDSVAADAASEGRVSGEALQARPAYRPGELLEAVPGLIVTQHSGEGKANQYFLRGFDLDHGTDLAITIDDMPINMRTHGHAQGYADINFLLPELVETLRYRKGTYFADEGDFSSAGALHIDYVDSLPRDLAVVSGGSFAYARGLAAVSRPAGAGTVLLGAELVHNDGPWHVPDDYQKANGILRYAQGTPENGFAITGMAYGGHWTATNQIAERAVDSGLIARFGTLDPTDGGNTQRYSLSTRWSRSDEDQATKLTAYVIRSELALYNDFTYFLNDPVNGDQIKQADARTIFGGAASRTYFGTLWGEASETMIGTQARYDDIDVGLFNTAGRRILATVREDRVEESSVGVFAQNTLRWSETIRSTIGLRGDLFHGDDRSDNSMNSGATTAFIANPKFGLVLGPFADTEYYINAGTGFHSNDMRGTTITVDPSDGVTPQHRVPLLVRSKGAEIGLRSKVIPGLETSLSFFVLDFDSELIFEGDSGSTSAGRPSRRIGFEWSNVYRPLSWLSLDLDAAYTRARFTNTDSGTDDVVAGHPGSYIPGAIEGVVEAGFDIDHIGNWMGGMRLRYFGPRPLTEDNSVRSKATTLVSARIGYKITEIIDATLDIFNLLDAKASQIDYYYASRLPGEPLAGVNDVHFHPVEPLSFRVTLQAKF
jgi:hypothetical protein